MRVFSTMAICFSLLTAGTKLHAQSAEELYSAAGDLYRQQHYAEAASGYLRLLQQGYDASEVHYNLANCYFKLDSIGKSILHYERALKHAPDNEDALHNLRLANSRAVDRIDPVPELALIAWLKRLPGWHASGRWAAYSLGLIWLAFMLAGAALFISRRRVMFSAAGVFALASLTFLTMGSIQLQAERSADWGILLASSANIKSAPDAGAGNLFLLHEGTKLKVLDKVGDWNKIRIADGKVGWIQSSAFERI